MIRNLWLGTTCLGLLLAAGLIACAGAGAQDRVAQTSAKAPATAQSRTEAARAEGEKRFRANCGRCHVAPQKFPPRVMATVIRHMRVRAMLTDEDMRLILQYMTE